MGMKTDRMNAIGQVFRRRWTLSILVAGAWTAVVTLYVLNGLRPHGYVGDETEAIFTWLGWMAGGGILLAWVVRKFLFDTSSWMGGLHAHAQASGYEEMATSAQEDADSRDACGLRMGAAGFGYYCGAIRTDND
jgi:hypothetical protein